MQQDSKPAETVQSKPPEPPAPLSPLAHAEPPMPWWAIVIAAQWPALKKYLIHLACIAIGVIPTALLYDHFIIPGKDAALQGKDATINEISEERDRANRDNDKLRTQNANYQTALAQKPVEAVSSFGVEPVSETITNFNGNKVELQFEPYPHTISLTMFPAKGVKPSLAVFPTMMTPALAEGNIHIEGRNLFFTNTIWASTNYSMRVDYFTKVNHEQKSPAN